MIRKVLGNWSTSTTQYLRFSAAATLLALVAGCATPPQKPSAPTPEEIAKQQRVDRAKSNLNDGLKKYDGGSYDEAMKNFLLALDSGQLPMADQLNARKHMAFVHCLSGREANCKDEFEKVFTLEAKFELSPAEAGHPIWGPIYRVTRTEFELRKSGSALPATTVKPMSPGEKLIQEGMKSYEDAEYNKAIRSFQDALKEPLLESNQVTARKFIAFSYCLTNRTTLCRTEFEAIFKLDENFDLAPAEAGHPAWGPSFRTVKAKRKPATPKK